MEIGVMYTATLNQDSDRAARLKASAALTLLTTNGPTELAADLESRSLMYGHLYAKRGGVFGGGGWVMVRKMTESELEKAKEQAYALQPHGCTCPTECDCEDPEPEAGPALCSHECPIHNLRPKSAPDCIVHNV